MTEAFFSSIIQWPVPMWGDFVASEALDRSCFPSRVGAAPDEGVGEGQQRGARGLADEPLGGSAAAKRARHLRREALHVPPPLHQGPLQRALKHTTKPR